MAKPKIRLWFGPQATEDRREYKLNVIEAEKPLKLAKERTKQVKAGGAEAVFGFGSTPEAAAGFLEDPTVQLGLAGLTVVGTGLAFKRYMGR